MPKLSQHTILIVEADDLTAMILAQAVQDEDGTPTVCGNAQEALLAISLGGVSAAILDNGICKVDPEVCNRLDQQRIPYILHEDLAEVHGSGGPTSADALIDKVAALLTRNP